MSGLARRPGERGQAAVLLVGVLVVVVVGGLLLGVYARAVGVRSDQQRAADLAALAGARALRDSYPRVFELGPTHLSRAQYEAVGRRVALETAARNGAPDADVDFPDADVFAPVVIRVRVAGEARLPGGRSARVTATAEAELTPDAGSLGFGAPGAGDYKGPFAVRQGKRMRPDVALAFDRMAAAARADGVTLIITSAFRADAEQAVLFARRPDPKWTARPGTSLHRLGTELDLGPNAAYGWLAANAGQFHFLKRYPWEPWHYGCCLRTLQACRRWRPMALAPTRGWGSLKLDFCTILLVVQALTCIVESPEPRHVFRLAVRAIPGLDGVVPNAGVEIYAHDAPARWPQVRGRWSVVVQFREVAMRLPRGPVA